jgi:signal transduction histidine kinase
LISLDAREISDGLIIHIEDNGVGIPVQDKEKIFRRGFGKNTGLGLFLAREILSITGITIRETGEYQHGARFELQVPKGVFRYSKPSGLPKKDLSRF